ncbi:MAG: MATE family efflux transporter [Lachnospiraceae bacterium]
MLKKILKDALPTIVSLTLSGMYSVVDGLFIGKATGDIGLAAINIAWPITAVITATGIGIGAGGSVLISHFRGRGEQEESQRVGKKI